MFTKSGKNRATSYTDYYKSSSSTPPANTTSKVSEDEEENGRKLAIKRRLERSNKAKKAKRFPVER